MNGLTQGAQPGLMTIAWRWRHELVLAALFALCIAAIIHCRIATWTLLVTGYALMVLGVIPHLRNRAVARVWCLITPHRVRRACAQARIFTRPGMIPIIRSTSRDPRGERVLVCCRAGVSAKDFHDARQIFRTTCWARDIIVASDPCRPHLVTLIVVRH